MQLNPLMKTCSKCQKEKPSDSFYKSNVKTHLDGLYPSCKTCKRKTTKKYFHENSEQCRRRQKSWRSKNKRHLKRKYIEYRYGGNRIKALERDGFKCQECGKKDVLDVHHIDGKGSTFPVPEQNNSIENLITLCRSCHRKIH